MYEVVDVSAKVFETSFALITVGIIAIGKDNVHKTLNVCREIENSEFSTLVSSKLLENKGNIVHRPPSIGSCFEFFR
jgi:hypothetical protein